MIFYSLNNEFSKAIVSIQLDAMAFLLLKQAHRYVC